MKAFINLLRKDRKAQSLLFLIIAVLIADAGFYFLRAAPMRAKVADLEAKSLEIGGRMKRDEGTFRVYSSFEGGREQIARFTDMLPRRSEYTAIINKVYRLAKDDGMKNTSFGTEKKELKSGDLAQLSFTMPISGNYRDVRKFISDIETSKLFLNINNLALSSNAETGEITLTIALSTYVRS